MNNPETGGIFHFIPGECRASAQQKKLMYTTTWKRTACLNINSICLVTKHLSSGCSPAGAYITLSPEIETAHPHGQIFGRGFRDLKNQEGSSYIPTLCPKYKIKKGTDNLLFTCPCSRNVQGEFFFLLWSSRACRMKRMHFTQGVISIIFKFQYHIPGKGISWNVVVESGLDFPHYNINNY